MKITLDIKAETIANMMISAMEGVDPVTTAALGGWCDLIDKLAPAANPTKGSWWYAEPAFYENPFIIEVVEVVDEGWHPVKRKFKKHKVTPAKMAKGLEIMAAKYPHCMADVLADNTDASTADIFLQCICFGEEKYA